MGEPQWFFDDALSRVRREWAASMREGRHADDGGQCESLEQQKAPTSGDRVVRRDWHASWIPVAGGHSAV